MTVQYRNEITDNKRYSDIDRAKGLAIILVVIGHLVSGEPPVDHQWFSILKSVIYKFHMPFFMYLSGFIFGKTYKIQNNFGYYKDYLLRRFKRLFPAYVIISFIICFGKIAASAFLHVDNVNYDIARALTDIFLRPSQSVAGFLWYIYVLLGLYVFFPVVIFISRSNLVLSVMICGVLHISTLFFDITGFLMINSLFKYSLPFSTGILAFKYYEKYLTILLGNVVTFQLLFICSFTTMIFVGQDFSKSIIGLISIPALHSLVNLNYFGRFDLLILLSRYTLTIYLFNTIMIGITKGLFLRFLSWNGVSFYFFILFAVPLALFVPVIIYNFVLIRIPFIKLITK